MAYVPNPADPATPSDTESVASAAGEFRALKLFLANTITAINNAITNGLALKAPLANPALTGVPTAPTAAAGTNTTQVATAAFIQAQLAANVQLTAAVTPLPVISGSAVISAAHTFGVVPSHVDLELVCLVPEYGYAIGDVVQVVCGWYPPNTALYLLTLTKNTTTVSVQVHLTTTWAIINRAVPGAGVTPTPANWAMRFRVFK